MVSVDSGSGSKKELNFDLNLMPIIDILTVCICFLLMTVVWLDVASLKSTQALGASGPEQAPKKATLWVRSYDQNVIELELVGSAKLNGKTRIAAKGSDTDWDQLNLKLLKIKKALPDLQTSIVVPHANLEYEKLIHVMEGIRKSGIRDVGIAPM